MFHAEILFPCTRVVSFPAFAVMVWLLVVAFCCLPAELKAEMLVNNLLFEWQHPSSWTSALMDGCREAVWGCRHESMSAHSRRNGSALKRNCALLLIFYEGARELKCSLRTSRLHVPHRFANDRLRGFEKSRDA